MIKQYESLLLLHPATPEEKVEEVLGRLKGVIERGDGHLHRTENLGHRKLAYEVENEKKGLYLLLSFEGNGVFITDLARACELEEAIMKHLTIALDKPSEASTPRRRTA